MKMTRRRDLTIGAVFSLLLLAAMAWLGSRTVRAENPPDLPPAAKKTVPFVVETDPAPVADVTDDHPKAIETAQEAPPRQPEVPNLIPPGAMTQPSSIVPPDTDKPTARIPMYVGWGPGSKVYSPVDLSEPPLAKYQARPAYPSALRQAGVSGVVTVDFVVDAEGNVRTVSAVQSSQPEFEDAAVRAVSRWKFRAGRKDGHAVSTHMQVPIVFSLDSTS